MTAGGSILVGGGFGGKSEIIPLEIIAAVTARAAKAPVKVTYTREEVFWAHRGRPRTVVDLKTGVKKDGRVTSVACKVIQDGGAYCSYGVVTILYSGALLGALYDIPNIRIENGPAQTHQRIGWMRSVSNINHAFAVHSFIDELAVMANRDRVEYLHALLGKDRKIDLRPPQQRNNPDPYMIDTARYKRVLDTLADQSGWAKLRCISAWRR